MSATGSDRQRLGPDGNGDPLFQLPRQGAGATKTRRGAMQVAPPFSVRPKRRARATRSRSAPGRTNRASHPESSIVAGTSRVGELGEDLAAGRAEPVSRTLSTPAAIARRAASGSSGRIVSTPAGRPAPAATAAKASAAAPPPAPRLPEHGVAGGEGLQGLHPRQEERVVRRRDHQDEPQRLAPHLGLHPAEPGRPAVGPQPAGGEQAGRLALQEAAGVGERHHLGGEDLRLRPSGAAAGRLRPAPAAFAAMPWRSAAGCAAARRATRSPRRPAPPGRRPSVRRGRAAWRWRSASPSSARLRQDRLRRECRASRRPGEAIGRRGPPSSGGR